MDKQNPHDTKTNRKYHPALIALTLAVGGFVGPIIGLNLTGIAHVLNHNEGAVVGGATAIVALFTWALWRATMTIDEGAMKTLAHLQITSDRESRGYVFFQERPKWSYLENVLAITFKNFGQTPVSDVEVFGYASSSPDDESRRVTKPFRIALGPQGTMDVRFDQNLPTGRIPQGCFVHGRIEYTALGVQRWTKFRYRWDNSDLENCLEGNDWL